VTNIVAFNAISQHCSKVKSQLSEMTVFCDFDGPIVDVSDRYYSTYQLALTETLAYYCDLDIVIHSQVLDRDAFWQMKKSRVPDVDIARLSGLEGEQIQFFMSRVAEIVNQPGQLHQDKIQAGVCWALTYLKVKGIKLVLVTLREEEQAIKILEKSGLLHLFTAVYGARQESAAYQNQPQQKTELLAQAIAEQLPFGMDGDRTYMIGDTEADIIAAQAAGVQSIAVTCGIRSYQFLERFSPTAIFSDSISFALSLMAQTQLVAA
jgi:phosphoglycolate phosphatase